jgi:hypothetical protein
MGEVSPAGGAERPISAETTHFHGLSLQPNHGDRNFSLFILDDQFKIRNRTNPPAGDVRQDTAGP